MPSATIENPHDSVDVDTKPRRQVKQLRAENEQLRAENRRLHATLAAYINRARSVAVFGPVEMTAGTCVGPRRRS